MRNNTSGKRGVLLGGLLCSCLVMSLGACDERPQDVTTIKPYADLVGTEYRVIADNVYAYGIYGDWPKRIVTYSVLIPGVGISGYEVGFRKHVPKGTIVSLVGVWKSWILFERVPFCVVTLRASDLR